MADGNGGSRPVPDPTILTTEQLLREIAAVKVLLESEIKGSAAVYAEKQASVATQFTLIERQRVEQKADTEKAVAAALSAAKEAVKEQTTASEKSITKSETATAEQLRQLTATFTTALSGVGDIVADLKDRVVKIESRKEGGAETKTALYAILALVISVAVIISPHIK